MLRALSCLADAAAAAAAPATVSVSALISAVPVREVIAVCQGPSN